MVNDILDLSKIEANKTITNNEPNSIDNIITNIIDIISFQSNSKNINIDYKENKFSHLNIDKKNLNKIVMNILSNAIKFTDNGGNINIKVKYLNSTNLSTDLMLEFTDNGRGIEKKDIERIFNPFEQIYDKDKDQGTGLGLFITKKIIEDMNGNISIESEVGTGTSIYITLKDIEVIKSKIVNKYHHMRREIHELKSKKYIAIVDDIAFNREVLKKKLEPYDFNIIEGSNGKDILDKLNEKRLPDVIFTDIKMPVMDGIELSRIIKDLEKTKHIPVIAITAQGMLDEETEIKKYCDGYLTKPIDNESLDLIISHLFKS
ncbi:ATP-binding response regulator [Aliivibrio sifiae]|uniref:ATP-binding response regulator n=1 Tax=Aliivibrio sifiae TaxID=566293 RepID=UPI0021571BD6|nr:hybrid sensor histidine kinase/response regulator [Aliivibrio sifiae]